MKSQQTPSADFDAAGMIASVIMRSPILREGLNKLLTDAGVRVHCESPARGVAPTIEAVRECGSNFVILDGSLCEGPSQLIVLLRQALPDTRVVIITARDSVNRIADENIAAAAGILSSESSSEEMMLSLRLIRLGSRVLPPDLLSHLLGTRMSERGDNAAPTENGQPAPTSRLPSPRETEILHYLTTGCSNKVIARRLGIAEATVKVHLKGLLRRIRVANRTQAAIWAMNNGIGPGGSAAFPDKTKADCAVAAD